MLFKDKNGKSYSLAINFGNARKVTKLYGVNLLDTQKTLEAISLDKEDTRNENTMLLIDMAFSLAESNAEGKSLDQDAFYESLDGDAINDLSMAFLHGLENFTTSPAMKIILQRSRMMIEKTQKELVEKVKALDFSEVLKVGN